mmetsp:Transcript_51987/g.78957  ORF Transcript_51987/g.78957 Transcript_51987/m.78957 type:complete len:134 (-) Transcript_51987:563-964(-)
MLVIVVCGRSSRNAQRQGLLDCTIKQQELLDAIVHQQRIRSLSSEFGIPEKVPFHQNPMKQPCEFIEKFYQQRNIPQRMPDQIDRTTVRKHMFSQVTQDPFRKSIDTARRDAFFGTFDKVKLNATHYRAEKLE